MSCTDIPSSWAFAKASTPSRAPPMTPCFAGQASFPAGRSSFGPDLPINTVGAGARRLDLETRSRRAFHHRHGDGNGPFGGHDDRPSGGGAGSGDRDFPSNHGRTDAMFDRDLLAHGFREPGQRDRFFLDLAFADRFWGQLGFSHRFGFDLPGFHGFSGQRCSRDREKFDLGSRDRFVAKLGFGDSFFFQLGFGNRFGADLSFCDGPFGKLRSRHSQRLDLAFFYRFTGQRSRRHRKELDLARFNGFGGKGPRSDCQ